MASYCAWLFLLVLGSVHGLHLPVSRNETGRGFTSEDEELFIHILSTKTAELQAIVQSGRRFLQRMRQWQSAHPAESRLAKCVARYLIETKIPGVVASSGWDADEDGRRGLSTPVWIGSELPEGKSTEESLTNGSFTDEAFQRAPNAISGEGGSSEWNRIGPSLRSVPDDVYVNKFLFKKKVAKALYVAFVHLREKLSQHKILGCGFQYLLSRFWQWVDTAP